MNVNRLEVRQVMNLTREKHKPMIAMRINGRITFIFSSDRVDRAYYHVLHEKDAWERLSYSLESASGEYFGSIGSDIELTSQFFLQLQKDFVITPTSVRLACRSRDARGKKIFHELPRRKGNWGGVRSKTGHTGLSDEEGEQLDAAWAKAVQEAAKCHSFMKYNIYVETWRRVYQRSYASYPPKTIEKRFFREVHDFQKANSL